MSTKIKYGKVLELAREIVSANPEMKNPQGADGQCVYNKLPGFDDTINIANRCLGGEILVRLDLALPPEGSSVWASPDKDKLTVKAMEFLAELQRMADYRVQPTNTPRPWGEALDLATSSFAEVYERFRFKDQ